MYADTMKGHQPKGRTGDDDIFKRLADAWPTYFPEEAEVGLSESDHKVRLATALAESFSTLEVAEVLFSRIEDDGTDIICLPIDFQQLQEMCVFIKDKLNESPKEALLCVGVAADLALRSSKINKIFLNAKFNKINIRFYNTGPRSLSQCMVLWLKVSPVKALVQQLEFRCMKCGKEIPRMFCDGKFSPPMSCIIQGCKSRSFIPDRSSAQLVDFQKIRIQELASADNHEEGQVPRTVECELTEDLVDCCIPGEIVTVTGIVKVLNNYMDVGGAGITLALFGGVQKNSMDQNKVPVRGDIHVIVVGDPGLGKSQLLQAAAAVSPRGIYVCENTTTKAGLTVAVVKDSMTNDYAFEAGAMVLADRGICCIDEFDKMFAEHQALLEAMEQQCVSVAKAGLVASLSARTSVLAAANPIGGHYDRAKTVNENLKMSAALLSRFDLVFILLDKPDESLDKRVSDHIIALHTNDLANFRPNKRIRTVSQFNGDLGLGFSGNSVASRLRLHPEKDKGFTPLARQLLRKYISYSREHVFPRMSKAAAAILKRFYLKLRNRSTSADGTPITARQLESLVRLAEARARVDLRDEVTEEDAQDVVDIMKESLYDKYVDEHGYVDFARSAGMSQPKEAKRFLNALNKESELQQKDCFSKTELFTLADKISLRVPDLDALVEKMDIEAGDCVILTMPANEVKMDDLHTLWTPPVTDVWFGGYAYPHGCAHTCCNVQATEVHASQDDH
ncbi:unnamed protein product [Miscanthus lutarioriparius]|uniref:Probable DNA helicase MCM8 n=1 Tax=Miscanthus lutarioriparius TaxID=422564 RepID=A0A811RWD5_9POAL|nr:unnamed protein product [Miscanthus lutarioriparius]